MNTIHYQDRITQLQELLGITTITTTQIKYKDNYYEDDRTTYTKYKLTDIIEAIQQNISPLDYCDEQIQDTIEYDNGEYLFTAKYDNAYYIDKYSRQTELETNWFGLLHPIITEQIQNPNGYHLLHAIGHYQCEPTPQNLQTIEKHLLPLLLNDITTITIRITARGTGYHTTEIRTKCKTNITDIIRHGYYDTCRYPDLNEGNWHEILQDNIPANYQTHLTYHEQQLLLEELAQLINYNYYHPINTHPEVEPLFHFA